LTPAAALAEMLTRTHEAMGKPRPISPRPVVSQLLADIVAGLRVLNTRDKLGIPDELLWERARNICTGIIGNYHIEAP
jgi:hypothetical protein